MKSIYYFTVSLLLFTHQSHALVPLNAKPGSAEFLIAACQEYTELYAKKDDPRFGAFLTTSKEESFRAGYCLGAIMHASNICASSYRPTVYRSAKAIASVNRDRSYSEALLLDEAVCH